MFNTCLKTNCLLFQNELIDGVILPVLTNIDQDYDIAVRRRTTQLLLEVCRCCTTPKFSEVLQSLEKVTIKLLTQRLHSHGYSNWEIQKIQMP